MLFVANPLTSTEKTKQNTKKTSTIQKEPKLTKNIEKSRIKAQKT